MSDLWTADQVKDHLEALLTEKTRALELADREREKAAAILRDELERATSEGDERLREHMVNQVRQINEALVAADKLEVARIHAVTEKLALLQQTADTAKNKFEETVQARFAQVNEFRGSLDDLSRQMATRRELEATINATGTRLEEQAKTIADLRSRLDVGPAGLSHLQSAADQGRGRQQGVQLTVGYFFSALAALGALFAMVAYLVTHSG